MREERRYIDRSACGPGRTDRPRSPGGAAPTRSTLAALDHRCVQSTTRVQWLKRRVRRRRLTECGNVDRNRQFSGNSPAQVNARTVRVTPSVCDQPRQPVSHSYSPSPPSSNSVPESDGRRSGPGSPVAILVLDLFAGAPELDDGRHHRAPAFHL